MKKSWLYTAFCALVLLLLLVPGIATLLCGPSQAGANEQLSRTPQLLRAGKPNVELLNEGRSYFDDHFAGRQQLITANAALTAAVFQQSASEDVLLGRDGWLYYADTLADYERSSPMTERQLYCAAHSLALMQEYCASQGCAFVFAAAPNKNTLYPQFMPGQYAPGEGASNLERLNAYLAREAVVTCDLVQVLSAQPKPVYYRTDSHWTPYGSALAHDALLACLGRSGTLAEEHFTQTAHTGDLYEMLYPAGTDTENGLALSRQRSFSYSGMVHGADDMTIRTTSQTGSGSLLMFRDSFGNTLHEDLAESFSAACFSRAMPYDLTLLENEQADTLIIELVERNLVKLSRLAPVLPGAVRELDTPQTDVSAQFSIRREQSPLSGCVCYTGTLICPQMDDDSPVYLCLDGTVYEACPTDGGFSLHAPAAETVALYILVDGELVLCTA